MFRKQVLTHLTIKTFQDGPYQKRVERMKIREDLIEIKLMISDLRLVVNLPPRIELDKSVISDRVIDIKQQNWGYLVIKCRVVKALSCTMLNGEQKPIQIRNFTKNVTFGKTFKI